MSNIDLRNQNRRDVVEAILNREEPVHEVARIFNVPQRTSLRLAGVISDRRLGRIEREEALGSSSEAQRGADHVGL